jgi:ParB-like nuclease domain
MLCLLRFLSRSCAGFPQSGANLADAALKPQNTASQARYIRVPVGQLRFDPENPRLGGAAKRKTQPQIQKYLEGPPHYALNLIGSMVENGFLPYEPLVVRRANKEFVVIEGNRRLAAVKAILDQTAFRYPPAVTARLKRIPVLVFPDADYPGDSEEVLRYLGVKHLFGFRDWPPVSKAMFLDKRVSSQKDLAQVLRELNITRQEAARYLIPYRLAKAAKDIFRKVNVEDFWSLAESFGRAKIKAYIQLDVDRRAMRIKMYNSAKLRHLTKFLYGPKRRVTDTRQLSALSRVLGSQEAARRLEKGATLDEASLYVESKQDTLGDLIRQIEKLFQKIKILSPGKEDSAKILKIVEELSGKLAK